MRTRQRVPGWPEVRETRVCPCRSQGSAQTSADVAVPSSPKARAKSDITAGDTRARSGSNKTRSVASAPERSTKAPKSSVSPAGRRARSKTAHLGRRVGASLPTHRTELADASDPSKGTTRVPKPMGSPARRVVRSKITHLVRTDHQGNPNEVRGEASGAEFRFESVESDDDRSNQGKEAGWAQDNIRTRSTKGPTTRAPSTTMLWRAPRDALSNLRRRGRSLRRGLQRRRGRGERREARVRSKRRRRRQQGSGLHREAHTRGK